MSMMKNIPVLDLRNTSVEALNEIEEIKNVAMMILPENPSVEFSTALAKIPQHNVACSISLPADAAIKQSNGQVELTPATLKQEGIIIISGQAVVTGTVEECNASLIVNGQFIHPKSSSFNIISCNGQSLAFDYEQYVMFNDDMSIDADMMDLMENKTFFLCNGDISFKKDVTLEMLKEKRPCFLFNGDVKCQKNIAAYLKLNASINGDLKIKGAVVEDDDEDDDED